MPRRFALALLALLVLLLAGLLAGRRVHEARQKQVVARPAPTRTIPPPPTPIPARLVSIWFESGEDGLFHPEAREVPAAVDDVAFLRSLGAAVLEGPRHPALLAPFPEGWTLRAAFRLAGGLAILDLAPPAPPAPAPSPVERDAKKGKAKGETPTPAPAVPEPPKRWETGSSEEAGAAQALVLTVTKNLPGVARVILLVGGEPVETLAGHVDLTHPLVPDLSRAADEPPLVAPMPEPPPSPTPQAAEKAPASAAPSDSPDPSRSPARALPPAAAPPPAVPAPKKTPATAPGPRPTQRPVRSSFLT